MNRHDSITKLCLAMVFMVLLLTSHVTNAPKCSAGHPKKPGSPPRSRKYPYPLNELAEEEKKLLASVSTVTKKPEVSSLKEMRMDKPANTMKNHQMNHAGHDMKNHQMNHAGHNMAHPMKHHNMGIKLSPGQGKEITLTHAKVSQHRLEKWIRTSGALDMESRTIKGFVFGKNSELLKVGQDVRLFTLIRRDPPIQGKLTRLIQEAKGKAVIVKPKDLRYGEKDYYIMEIVVNRGRHLAIPNEAILEEGDHRVVYLRTKENQYHPRTVKTGFQGEIYTKILQGLTYGEEIVTFGSFFIDAQYKLNTAMKTGGQSGHHHH